MLLKALEYLLSQKLEKVFLKENYFLSLDEKQVQLLLGAHLLNLYRELFPVEWKKSRHPVRLGNSKRVVEFLELIHFKKFPLCREFEQEDFASLWEESYWLNEISIWGLGPDVANNDTTDNMNWWALLPFFRGYDDETLDDRLADEIDRDRFDRLCKTYGKPLDILPIAIDILNYNVENPWLYYCADCDPPRFPWTKESVLQLAEGYQEAIAILERVDELLEWLNDDETRLDLCIQLWNSCAIKATLQQSLSGAGLL